MELKDQKQCPKCYTKIDKKAKYCQECGEKQKEEETRDVEILNRLEKVDIASNEEYEDQFKEEKQEEKKSDKSEQNDEQSKSNLEKTVEIESNVEENLCEEPILHVETEQTEEPEYNVELGEDFNIETEEYEESDTDTQW